MTEFHHVAQKFCAAAAGALLAMVPVQPSVAADNVPQPIDPKLYAAVPYAAHDGAVQEPTDHVLSDWLQQRFIVASAAPFKPEAIKPRMLEGYIEVPRDVNGADGDQSVEATLARSMFKIMQKNRHEMDNLMTTCTTAKNDCPQLLLDFKDMLDYARGRSRLEQVALVNAWVNSFILYDNDEVANTLYDYQHRPLTTVFKDGKGICDEQAQLKIYALIRLGFDARDVRLLDEKLYDNGILNENFTHAVVLASVANKKGFQTIWVLNNNNALPDRLGTSIFYDDACDHLAQNSYIEDIRAHLNWHNQSDLRADGATGTPNFIVDYQGVGLYKAAKIEDATTMLQTPADIASHIETHKIRHAMTKSFFIDDVDILTAIGIKTLRRNYVLRDDPDFPIRETVTKLSEPTSPALIAKGDAIRLTMQMEP